jgi:hypothetical protein
MSCPLLKNAAAGIFPLNSNTLILIKALAHNLFHKICEEAHTAEQDKIGCDGKRAGQGASQSARGPIPGQGWDYTSLGASLSSCASRS